MSYNGILKTIESGKDQQLTRIVNARSDVLGRYQPNPIPGLQVRAQERMLIGESEDLEFRIDLILTREEKGDALAVLETKYKVPESPSTDDIAQVVAYAEAKRCREAALVYPV